MNWSEEQKKIISLRGKNILVSAAAGSGKTAVMVERIISMISDKCSDTGLDELLVMTFTNAAAGGMRERIGRSLREKSAAEPDNKKLKLENAILPRAAISTIHSFCQRLIKQNYQLLDIDPGFRLADEAESVMMRGDVLSELLEEKYGENADSVSDEGFKRLINTFEAKNFDARINELVNTVYDFITGQPWPDETADRWLCECKREAVGDFEDSTWYKNFEENLKTEALQQKELLEEAAFICTEGNGPAKYECIIETEAERAETISHLSGYENLSCYIKGIEFARMPSINKKDAADQIKKEFVKERRDDFKKWINGLCTGEFLLSAEEMRTQTKGAAELAEALLLLTKEFAARYAALKKDRNVLDFNDLEHRALELLYEKKPDGERKTSQLADELAEGFKEIMIDEYQDSNHVQEALINALSAERFGRPDVFTVGDVKQSIYRFRNARPELFNKKYRQYSSDEHDSNVKIELNANYRSRKEVLNSVNAVFDRIMSKELGGIEYDQNARLKCGAEYPDGKDAKTEVLYLDTSPETEDKPAEDTKTENDANALNTENGWNEKTAENKQDRKQTEPVLQETEESEDDEDLKDEELEYKLIAFRIKRLLGRSEGCTPFMVRDSETGRMRPAGFGDITILIRKKKSAKPLIDILRKNGVPAYFDDSKGYFDAAEVNMVLSMLSIIDNPLQDIPLVTVLKGAAGGFDNNELAEIKAAFNDSFTEEKPSEPGDFYRALKYYAQSGNDLCLREKAARFTEELNKYRDMADILPVYMLLNEIYINTGYYSYVSAMPLGDVKKKNLDMLMKKAEDFGKTGYQGLFNFVRYIESLKKYDTDYGEAPDAAGSGSSVNISTIHGSKGLEYPIVILARAAESFEGRGRAESLAIDDEGIGTDYTDLENGIIYPSLKRLYLRKKKKNEETAEEQRLLYVAMTRAMEKLIITGASKKASEKLNKSSAFAELYRASAEKKGIDAENEAKKLPPAIIKKGKCYLDWILSAADDEAFEIKAVSLTELKMYDEEEQKEKLEQYAGIKLSAFYDDSTDIPSHQDEAVKELSEKVDRIFGSEYTFKEETKLKPKISVSEIKEAAIEEAETAKIGLTAESNAVLPEELRTELISNKGTPNHGALSGTAFHRAMELLSYEGTPEKQLDELMNSDRFAEAERALLNKSAVLEFLESGIAERMARAEKNGTLRREQHFMAGFPACTLKKNQQSSELQILQGIIDAYFEENGELILVDYKTDKVSTAEELKDRYSVQLELYSRALEQLTHKKVRERIIYSTFLKCEIAVE